MTQLTEQQVQQIHLFVKKHYVEHYDVELELVDHLANGIELQWTIDNNITFDNALQIEFKKFGVYGFSDIIEEKTKRLTGSYIKLLFKTLLGFFTFPRIVLTTALFLLLCLIGKVFPNSAAEIYSSLLIITFLLYVFVGIQWHYAIRKLCQTTNKKFLISSIAIQGFGLPIIGGMFTPFLTELYRTTENSSLLFQTILYSFLILVFALCTFITTFTIRPLIRKNIEDTIHKYKLT
ncbi:hypothetical protein [Myroides phaeus]|uniref:hypothetical protein n=1 Tax=Myroides phaeus TaxID=702745 RepID=UPI0013034070|nr:hypothetical protein [Myroides phaeus]